MEVDKTIKILEKKLKNLKRKYYFKSFFRKARNLVTEFLPLDEITEEYFSLKITVKEKKEVPIYLPKIFSKNQIQTNTIIEKIQIYALQNIYCVTNSTYFLNSKKDKTFYEKWHDDDRNHYLYNTKNLLQHALSLVKVKNLQKIYFETEAIFLGGTFTFNYYHFLIEILSKTEFFNQIPNYKDKMIVVDAQVQGNKNMIDLLNFFLKDYKILFLESNNYYHFKNLWHITSPNYTIPNVINGTKYEAGFTKLTAESLDYLKIKCLENVDQKQINIENIEKIFISRKSKFRTYNQNEIFQIAQKHGFKEVFFEELNIHEQIFLVQNANYIIGPSGAAWTNILFTKPNAKGLTWLSSVWGDFSVYSTMAKHMQFDLYFHIYPQISDDFHENYWLDPEIFSDQLKKLLLLG